MDSEPLPSVFERVFTHALDLLCVAGFDGYFKVLNPAWTKTLGWTTAELLARPWLDFVHPDDHQATRNATLHLRDGKLLYQFENRYFCKDGTVRWLSWDSYPYPDDQVIIAVARDVTDAKSALLRERFQFELQQAVADLSARFVLMTDVDFDEGVQFALQRLGELLEMDRTYLFRCGAGLESIDNTHEWCASNVTSQQEHLRDLPVADFPWWRKHVLTQQPVHVWDIDALPTEAEAEKQEMARQNVQSLLCLPLRHTSGELLGFVGGDSVYRKCRWTDAQIAMLQVVAETMANAINRIETFRALRISEDRLRQSAEQSRQMFEMNRDGITVFRLTPDGRPGCFIDANPAASAMLGYTKEEFLDLAPLDLEPGATDAQVAARLAELQRKGTARLEATLQTKDGGHVTLDVHSVEIDYDGRPAIMNIGRDITQRKQLEAKMAEQLRELQRWHDVTLGRETRVLDLKREVNELLTQAGLPPKYQSVHDGLKPDP